MNRAATEELILSTPHSHPPTPANPGVRPSELRDEFWQEALEGAKRSVLAMELRA